MLNIKEPDKFVSAFMEGPSYKHLNMIITVIANAINAEEVKAIVEQWLNQEEHLKQLAFVENLLHPETWKEDGFVQVMQQFKDGQKVTVEMWQEVTNGQAILVANSQYFVLVPVAILMGISINAEVLKHLQGEINKIQETYVDEYALCATSSCFNAQSPIIQFICIHSWATIEWWMKMFYDKMSFAIRRWNYFNTAIGLMDKYLK